MTDCKDKKERIDKTLFKTFSNLSLYFENLAKFNGKILSQENDYSETPTTRETSEDSIPQENKQITNVIQDCNVIFLDEVDSLNANQPKPSRSLPNAKGNEKKLPQGVILKDQGYFVKIKFFGVKSYYGPFTYLSQANAVIGYIRKHQRFFADKTIKTKKIWLENLRELFEYFVKK